MSLAEPVGGEAVGSTMDMVVITGSVDRFLTIDDCCGRMGESLDTEAAHLAPRTSVGGGMFTH